MLCYRIHRILGSPFRCRNEIPFGKIANTTRIMHIVPSTADEVILNVRRSAAGTIILNFQPSLYALRMKIMLAPLFL